MTLKIKLEVAVARLPSVSKEGIEFDSVSDAMVYADRAGVVCSVLLDSIASIRKQVKVALDEQPILFYGSKSQGA